MKQLGSIGYDFSEAFRLGTTCDELSEKIFEYLPVALSNATSICSTNTSGKRRSIDIIISGHVPSHICENVIKNIADKEVVFNVSFRLRGLFEKGHMEQFLPSADITIYEQNEDGKLGDIIYEEKHISDLDEAFGVIDALFTSC